MTTPHLNVDYDPVVEDLLPETIEGVASRLLISDSFEELVYRECELDALWTLADLAIELATLQEGGQRFVPWQAVVPGGHADLVMLRALIEQAHELASDQEVVRAAEVLRDAARLGASWS